MPCVILSLSNCTLFDASKPIVIDSFCQVYEPVVQAKGEGAIIASSQVKRRILANEQTYRGTCK